MVIALFLPFVGGPIICSLLLRYNSLNHGQIFEYFIFEDNFTTWAVQGDQEEVTLWDVSAAIARVCSGDWPDSALSLNRHGGYINHISTLTWLVSISSPCLLLLQHGNSWIPLPWPHWPAHLLSAQTCCGPRFLSPLPRHCDDYERGVQTRAGESSQRVSRVQKGSVKWRKVGRNWKRNAKYGLIIGILFCFV